MDLRTSAIIGDAEQFDIIDTIIEALEADPTCGRVVVADEGVQWPQALYLAARDASLLIPVIGNWPLGVGVSTLPDDLSDVSAESLLPALKGMSRTTRRPGDIMTDFKEAQAVMEHVAHIALCHLVAEDHQLVAQATTSDGTILCEIGMGDDGQFIVWIESSDDIWLAPIPRRAVDDLTRTQPLLLCASAPRFDLDGIAQPSIVIEPLNTDEMGGTLEAQLPSPIEVLRMLGKSGAQPA